MLTLTWTWTGPPKVCMSCACSEPSPSLIRNNQTKIPTAQKMSSPGHGPRLGVGMLIWTSDMPYVVV